jgi:hypothetical protein
MTMNATGTPVAIDRNDKWLYKAGGVFAFVATLVFIIEVVLGLALGKLPNSNGLDWLTSVNDKGTAWSAIIYVTLIGDLAFLFVYPVLYIALRPVGRGLMLMATIWAVFGVILDEVISNANFGSLIFLGGKYATGTASQRTADVAAADYAAAILGSRIESIFSFVIPGVALILIGIVMLRSPFGRRIAYLGIAAGFFDLIQITGWDLAALFNTVLQAVFFAVVGRHLYFRYAKPAAELPAELAEDPLSV